MKKDYGKEQKERLSGHTLAQRALHGWQPKEAVNIFPEKVSYTELSEIAEQAKRRTEMAR